MRDPHVVALPTFRDEREGPRILGYRPIIMGPMSSNPSIDGMLGFAMDKLPPGTESPTGDRQALYPTKDQAMQAWEEGEAIQWRPWNRTILEPSLINRVNELGLFRKPRDPDQLSEEDEELWRT